MSQRIRRLTSAAAAILFLAAASPAFAGPTVSLGQVTWYYGAGGAGTFKVTLNNAGPGPLTANAVWAQAVSPGAPTLQAGFGAAKQGVNTSVDLAPTANGRCYTIALQIEPDSGSLGIKINPKAASKKVCLDPDGKGIIP